MRIANEGVKNEDKRIAIVFNHLSTQQKQLAESLYTELNPLYSIKGINSALIPKPLTDKESRPEHRPIKKVIPEYPKKELKEGHMGYTVVEITISPEGYPREIEVKQAFSRNFTRESIRALQKSLFKPTQNQKPIYGHPFISTFVISGAEINSNFKNKLISNLNDLKSSAQSGDAIAQYRYAEEMFSARRFRGYLKDVDLEYKNMNHWLLQSAQQGLPHAQHQLGKNMIGGRGCKVDTISGNKWITAAAVSGFAPAQKSLAQSSLLSDDEVTRKSTTALGWLRNAAQSGHYSAKLLLAWELATSPLDGLRNGEEALELLNEKSEYFYDDLRIAETKAATYAELGNFKKPSNGRKKH
ncbi:energy transducer TonB [Marinibactrum halimedae]|nr:energy transducer TonB [Marinibactrum halimedae]MCD9460551.1 energy transducer TonB [Marinibactrum halimedae]